MTQFAKTFLFVGILMIAASPALAVVTVSNITDADLPILFDSQLHVGEGRAGDGAATATYEVGVGGTMGAPTVSDDYTWINNILVPVLFVYDAGTDLVTFSIDGVAVQETIVLSTSTDILLRIASTRNNLTMELENIIIDAEEPIGVATATNGHDILWISGAVISDGFVLSADVRAQWGGNTPNGDQLSFSASMGTIIPVPTEEASWGAIKALFD
jgi:hypothetical protein